MVIVNVFSDEKHILAFNDGDDLQKIYDESKQLKPIPYKSNPKNYIKKLEEAIEK